MKRCSPEFKDQVVRRLMPPNAQSVAAVSRDTGVSVQTLYHWRHQYRREGQVVPANPNNPERWSGADKLAVVIETAALNESDLAEYCRRKGLYPEQIARWREAASLFRTLKYGPSYPCKPFEDLHSARQWVQSFVRWYNQEHRHSGIRYVTPAQHHCGEDQEILDRRRRVYEQAKERTPERWSGATRDWSYIANVWLNPEKEPAAGSEKNSAAA